MNRKSKAGEKGNPSSRLHAFDARYFSEHDVSLLAGVDEAGRGALAGPVVAGAVVLDANCVLEGVNDSKQLSASAREAVFARILRSARAVAVGWASAEEIDRINILQASLLAARRAIEALQLKPQLLLADALKMEGLGMPVESLIKGDSRSQAIAAASIVAKVTRDRWMVGLDREYPGYGFAVHKGYAVQAHMDALRGLGASTVHRHSFRGVDWLGCGYRHSELLRGLLSEMQAGRLSRRSAEAIWKSRNPLLPECEDALFRTAMQAPAGNEEDLNGTLLF